MSERKDALKARLQAARDRWDAVLDAVGDRWEVPVYSDGLQWTVRQLVNHMADAERGQANQAMNIAEGKDIIPEDFDIERYNKRFTEKTAEKSAAQSRTELVAQRQQFLQWLDALDEAKLDNRGRHSSLQMLTVEEIIDWMAEHERRHAEDLGKVLDA
jgi:uncharacterized damage-inducible protein DinB